MKNGLGAYRLKYLLPQREIISKSVLVGEIRRSDLIIASRPALTERKRDQASDALQGGGWLNEQAIDRGSQPKISATCTPGLDQMYISRRTRQYRGVMHALYS